ncbi:hypothetical protein FHX82_003930 [Amycolatopsis bartoniae]|uniref:DUF2637 domain-containing protein n=1 Tax=Amycolatopsis bartoniae TaxID=941986 RepID=A0A8H9M9P7_9PSEU|nr:hypothetical protein [Amycolatopsis bartoniae]MBB2936866.1 hypothetical protein [Amycolatopsis bartoniae]GHF50751.1 hypothetical protein GCM10017566_24840 [Amycolatopsis bartoniae]
MTVERAAPRRPDAESAAGQAAVVQAVTAIMGTVVGLTFLFGFGNVLDLALRLGVPVWVAPLVAPAVDLSILGLLLGTRHLVVQGVELDSLRGARRLLIFASFVTLALNVADPLVRGSLARLRSMLLIGWSEVGPSLLHALSASTSANLGDSPDGTEVQAAPPVQDALAGLPDHPDSSGSDATATVQRIETASHLLDRAREEDLRHRLEHQRPISAETLRRRLRIGADCSRQLVAQVRRETQQAIPARADERVDRIYRSCEQSAIGGPVETSGVSTNRPANTAATRTHAAGVASVPA